MPHFNITVSSDGPVIDLAVAIGRTWEKRLAARAVPIPSPRVVRALIDTGADLSAVHPEILGQLGGRATGSVRIRRPGARNFRLAPISDVELAIGRAGPNAPWIPTQVVGVAPSIPTVLALIGRDLLRHCTMFYNGPRDELTLSC